MPMHNAHTVALDYFAPRTAEEYDRVCQNWERAGYEYWTTRDHHELWRHPITDHVAEMAI